MTKFTKTQVNKHLNDTLFDTASRSHSDIEPSRSNPSMEYQTLHVWLARPLMLTNYSACMWGF